MKKMISMILAVLMIATLFTACGNAAPTDANSDLAYIKDKGKLVVGITDYEPMDYKDENGQWIGFDAEFAQLFAKELGVECEFYVIADWGKKYMELETKQIDAVWNGMTIKEESLLNSSVSEAYANNGQVVVMKADAVANYATAEDLSGLTIAVENGSAGQDVANTITGATVVPLQDQGSALLEVKAGTADACIIDGIMAAAMTGEGTDYAELAFNLTLSDELFGVSFRKESDVTAVFNEFLAKLKEDGTLQALADKYKVPLAE